MNKKEKRLVQSTLENAGFSVDFDRGCIGFHKYSPAGQDFRFYIGMRKGGDIDDLTRSVYKYYESYDPSAEAMIWLDESGHGRCGAPYEMGDVYADMVACEQYIHDVYTLLSDLY